MIHTVIDTTAAKLALFSAQAAARPQTPFSVTPVIHPQNGVKAESSRTFWSAVSNSHYIRRETGNDMFGPTPDFAAKLTDCPDLVAHGRRGPIGCEADGVGGLDIWRAADEAAVSDRPTAPVAWHAIGWLPTGMGEAGWRELVLQFLDERFVANGMVVDWCIHALPDEEGGWIKRPHMHAVATARFWKGPRIGQPQAAWLNTAKSRSALEAAWVVLTGQAL
jgi:hypothetical protein